MKILRLMCLALLLLLTGCGVFAQTPPDEAIRLAIETQLAHTQQSLSQDLGLLTGTTLPTSASPNFRVANLNVRSREALSESKLLSRPNIDAVYRVRGTFEAALTVPGYQATESEFEVYLGTNTTDKSEVATWFLIQPY